jgi:hypothetical protein
MAYVRRVRTRSGAVAVQIVTKERGEVAGIEHIGSANSDEELALLLGLARERLTAPGQAVLAPELEDVPGRRVRLSDVADWTRRPEDGDGGLWPVVEGRPGTAARSGGRVRATASLVLWRALEDAYERVGLGVVPDEAFQRLVLARIVEPTSKASVLRVLSEVGVSGPSLRTVFRMLRRCVERDYRGLARRVCRAVAPGLGGPAAIILYDVTVRHEALVV